MLSYILGVLAYLWRFIFKNGFIYALFLNILIICFNLPLKILKTVSWCINCV
jgi:hypothetical protein